VPAKSKRVKRKEQVIIGWREVVKLPDWDIEELLAKADSGARTSAIDVADLEELPGDRVRFDVVLSQRHRHVRRTVEADVSRRSRVRSSNGQVEERVFVTTRMRLGEVEKDVEFSLVCRRHMLCRLLLGRKALAGDFLVNCRRRYLFGRPTQSSANVHEEYEEPKR
jgi:hypothetical protein